MVAEDFGYRGCDHFDRGSVRTCGGWEMTALRLAAQQALEPVAAVAKNATAQFDHGIGADRFKVVRGAYWWHVLIGDSQTKRGKFHTQAGAEEMAALLLREFRNGAFVQHEAALAQQAEPVAVAERERIAAQWDGCVTHQLDTFGPVDIGASIRAGELVEPAQQVEPVATLTAQRDALLEALKYHQEQTRPIQKSIDAIQAAEENT